MEFKRDVQEEIDDGRGDQADAGARGASHRRWLLRADLEERRADSAGGVAFALWRGAGRGNGDLLSARTLDLFRDASADLRRSISLLPRRPGGDAATLARWRVTRGDSRR